MDHEKLSFHGGEYMISADKVLSEPQLSRLLKRLRTEKERAVLALQNSHRRNPKETRIIVDYFLFSLISTTGLRISEALNLMWSDTHEDFLIIRPEISKNKKRGTVYFGDKTKKLLKEFRDIKFSTLKRGDSEYLFALGGPIPSRCYMHLRFKYWIQQTGLPSTLSIHSLRHTYATICLERGLPLTFVRDNLRHSHIAVTSQYLHLTQASRDKVKDIF